MSQPSTMPPGVLMLGTGEYTTGFTGQGASDSDKSTGVVALVMLDLRRRGKVGRLGMERGRVRSADLAQPAKPP